MGDEKAAPSRPPGGKRFVQPYRLSEAQRAEMFAPLEQNGIGDDESRRLFAAALEYDLASCRQLTDLEDDTAPVEGHQAAEQRDEAIAEIAKTAQRLAQQIEQLEGEASQRLQRGLEDADRFQRSYGEKYLESLRCELLRVAGTGGLPEMPEKTAPHEPPIPDDARRFILRAADAFEACFELTPTTEPDSAFRTAIEAIVAATGIRVPTDVSSLTRALERD